MKPDDAPQSRGDGSRPNPGRPRRRAWTPLPGGSSAPTPVRSALDHLASTMGMTDVDGINLLFVEWGEIVGPQLATHCKPKSLRHRVLTVEASDQQWATELKWMTSLLIDRCCAALGAGAVDEVRIIRSPTG